ncbi:tetratricopeptide repeat protein [Epilithonimonas ginsengisoli]|uniref:Tetratricopeptide repeat protein n=1 Tax=Epilithonimonas ginsengisoli TaxID=1245592 RepID=A0ABU4JHY3_9FLAO|nr:MULTISPECIES: tetratricopeptide repeat protein [Chryseobacterium group]MBV6880529.1 tetratricopeptide repeat protein [Epilithonimonas sp. FP105]MDW8549136.1 tetratricopeptide repeat protein [Epilithonimonas ginsengisoli]OAH72874.1 hypothetical protein AXA65_09320 [Chryseobacterium sp. FP211-J200]
MKYLIIVLLGLILNSCEKSEKEKSTVSSEQQSKSIIPDADGSNQNCKVLTKDKDLILNCGRKQIVYKNLIVNEMSISTELIQNENHSFSLLYELNASATKMKEKYDFIYSDQGITLVDKEIMKFGQEGLMINRIYVEDFDMSNKTYDDLQSLGSELPDNFELTKSSMSIYDSKKTLFATQDFQSTIENIFIEYPDVGQSEIKIINVESANNQAFALEKIGANEESKTLLEEITRQFPNRIVAYLNLGDVYWKLNEKDKAKENYIQYISLIKTQKKDLSKIPKRVYDRTN